jgi:hypothetical protein
MFVMVESSNKVRHQMLSFLYQAWKKNKPMLNNGDLVRLMDEPDFSRVDHNISYLETNEFVFRFYPQKSRYWNAIITARGVDAIENPKKYEQELPL